MYIFATLHFQVITACAVPHNMLVLIVDWTPCSAKMYKVKLLCFILLLFH